jgi:hypothetical protein
MQAIERVERPDVASFRRNYLRTRRPIVLVGAQENWPARSWTIEGLRDRIGSLEVRPVVLSEGHVHVDLKRGLLDERMPFRAFVDHLGGPPPPRYSLPLQLVGPYSFLRQDLTIPRYCVGNVYTKINMWIAARRTITDAHYDMMHNLLAQLQGARVVTLFPPSETPFMYPYPMRTLHWHHSQVQVDAPDLSRFPRFSQARAVRVELTPGDILFIPRGWWHQVEATEPSIAVNFFWLTPRLVPAIAMARVAWTVGRIRSS